MHQDPPRWIVTGASGWLGGRLVDVRLHGLPDVARFREPAAGVKIRVLVPPGEHSTARPTGVEVVEGDLRDPETSRRLCAGGAGAVLVHTAGVIHPRRVHDFFDVNVEGSRHLLEAAVEAGVRRAVVISSNSPCGCNPRREHRFDESTPYHPYLNYGRSKQRMEEIVHERQAEGRIETVILRPPWFYGPFQPPRQTLFFRMIRDGKAPIVGDGENPRSMCYIDNLCAGVLLAAEAPEANGRTYWIADARPYPLNEVIDTVERLLEGEFQIPCAHRRLRLPALAGAAARGIDATLQTLGLYHQKIHVLGELDRTIACDIGRARSELGYEPAVALEEGMRRSLAWCLAQRLL